MTSYAESAWQTEHQGWCILRRMLSQSTGYNAKPSALNANLRNDWCTKKNPLPQKAP
jgi:hypothetical protein